MPRRGVAAPIPGAEPDDSFASRVLRWQRQHGRHQLPWQGTRDPYRVWLSEVMLQQTQVSTVLTYYPRFLDRFPTVRALAEAPLGDVLGLWSGLGYYSRARNLHRAAQAVVALHGGQFPPAAAQLITLPGVGRSTAAAIAAFCFGERAAILDGNVKRVLARAFAFDGDLARAPDVERLWTLADSLLPAQGIESYTQGLMDLGSGVCLTRSPRCDQCPVAGSCRALSQGRPEAFPVKTRKLKRGARFNVWLWLRRPGQVWLTQRPDQGVWAGLWSLPEFASIEEALAALDGLPGDPAELAPLQHALTHFDWTLLPLQWTLPSRLPKQVGALLADRWALGRWVDDAQALTLGIPAPLRRLLAPPRSA